MASKTHQETMTFSETELGEKLRHFTVAVEWDNRPSARSKLPSLSLRRHAVPTPQMNHACAVWVVGHAAVFGSVKILGPRPVSAKLVRQLPFADSPGCAASSVLYPHTRPTTRLQLQGRCPPVVAVPRPLSHTRRDGGR